MIVVLVILAILAAAAIPTMKGFVDDAKDKQYLAEARAAYVACQYIATRDSLTTELSAAQLAEVKTLADVTGTTSIVTMTAGKVTKITYEIAGKTITIENGKAATVTGD